MRDGSQFNYRLRELLDGGFIDGADGRYPVRQPGARGIATVRTGYLTDHPEIEPFVTTGTCYACGGPPTARYADGLFFAGCTECDQLHSLGWFSPGALDSPEGFGVALPTRRAGRPGGWGLPARFGV